MTNVTTMNPRGEMILIECKDVTPFGKEVKTDSGIVLSAATAAKDIQEMVPAWGEIVSVGDAVPEELPVGTKVLLPDSTRYQKVYEPRVVNGELKRNSPEQQIFVTTHFKNISIVYK